ncbi:MAG: hypothetical protein DA330_10840 [Nitrososphaera sp.]|nr:hypothetical protein [Nitrososphaera sp.]
MDKNGQVIMPSGIRKRLGIKSGTDLVFAMGGNIVMKKLDTPDAKKWSAIFQSMRKKNLKLGEHDVSKEIRAYRKEKCNRPDWLSTSLT